MIAEGPADDGTSTPGRQGSTAEQVIAALVRARATVATAESFTGGLIVARLTDIPGSSQAVRGSVVAYHGDIKTSLLSVDAELIADAGAVQAQVATQLAVGAARALSATWGVGTTGVAGPGAADGHRAGTAFIAVCGPAHRQVREFAFPGDRHSVREAGVHAALSMLVCAVTEQSRGASPGTGQRKRVSW